MFKAQPVPPPFPMERAAYRQALVKMLQYQLALVAVGLACLFAADRWGNLDLKFAVLLVLLAAEWALIVTLDRRVNVEGRLMDCFPGYQPRTWWIRYACILPLVNVALLTFLWYREAGPAGQAVPVVLRHQRKFSFALYALPLVPVFANFFFGTGNLAPWARWVLPAIAQPTMAHISEVAVEVGLIFRAREAAKLARTEDALARAVNSMGWQGPTSSGLILVTATTMAELDASVKAQKRATASTGEAAGTGGSAVRMLGRFEELSAVAEASRTLPYSYHPLHFFSPGSVMEIAFGSMVNFVAEAKYAAMVVEAVEATVPKQRQKLHSDPAALAALEAQYQRLRAGRLYKRHQQARGSFVLSML